MSPEWLLVAAASAAIVLALVLAVAAGGGMMGGRGPMHAAFGGTDAAIGDRGVEEFYAANCAACHGRDRRGGVGPALLPAALTRDDGFYYDVIANGRPGTVMPAWSRRGLGDEDIRALVAFLRTQP